MSKGKKILLVLNLALVIGYINWVTRAKERKLHDGRLILLELAPVDPRSLIQGDYMRLDYEINRLPNGSHSLSKRGYCILRIDSSGVARRVRFQTHRQPSMDDEIALKYYSEGNQNFKTIHIGAESYFFEEGTAGKYERARFGGLKVDQEGNTILVGLYDKSHKLL